jgi:protein FAM32A
LEKEVADARREDGGGKTEAERRYEERKRKRLDERLRREGVKTHKERVEELNRYLSRLSEHHDMPRIGPG